MKNRAERLDIQKNETKRIYVNEDLVIDITCEGKGRYEVSAYEQLQARYNDPMECMTIYPNEFKYKLDTVKQLNKHDVSRTNIEELLDLLYKNHNAVSYKYLVARNNKPKTALGLPEEFTDEELQEIFKDNTTHLEITHNTGGSKDVWAVFGGKVGVFYNVDSLYAMPFKPKDTIEYYLYKNDFSDESALELNLETLEAINEDKCRL